MKKIFLVLLAACLLWVTPALAGTDGDQQVVRGKISYADYNGGKLPVIRGYVLDSQADLANLGHYYVEVSGKKLPNMHSIGLTVLQVKDINVLDKGDKRLILEGPVEKVMLESGFYSVQGYRLVGDYDFAALEGKMVRVGGLIDDSPSIFMTKAIKVFELEKVDQSGPTGLRGVVKQYLHENKHGVSYQLDGYVLIGPYQFQQYQGMEVLISGTVSPGLPVDGRPVFNVAEIKLLGAPDHQQDFTNDNGPGGRAGTPGKPWNTNYRIEYQGNPVKLSSQPVILNGRTMIAPEDLAGFEISYEFTSEDSVYIKSTVNSKDLKAALNMRQISTPDGMIDIDVAPVRYEGQFWLPLRAVLKHLGYQVVWHEQEAVVAVTNTLK